jgi:hypothetical protein
MMRAVALTLLTATASVIALSEEDAREVMGSGRQLAHHEPADPNKLPSVSGCMITPTHDTTAVNSAPAAVNEPCYIHDATCVGYQVCCLKIGVCDTLGGMVIKGNTKYYDGGCGGKELPAGCNQQGECNSVFLEQMMGGTVSQAKIDNGDVATPDSNTMTRFMASATGNDCQTKCGDADGDSTNGDQPVTDADCGEGFKYDPLAKDKICAGATCDVSSSADHTSATAIPAVLDDDAIPGTADHDHRYCCIGASCGDKDGVGPLEYSDKEVEEGKGGITDADCGEGWVVRLDHTDSLHKWHLTDQRLKCKGKTCEVGSETAEDQGTCCMKKVAVPDSAAFSTKKATAGLAVATAAAAAAALGAEL